MNLKGSGSKSISLLPSGSTDFLYRRLIEVCGIALLLIALLGTLSLVTYSPDDPNFNHATDNISESSVELARLATELEKESSEFKTV